jgi:hypothetical protein
VRRGRREIVRRPPTGDLFVRRRSLLVLSIIVGCQQPSTPTATSVVEQFYRTAIADSVSGAPTEKQLAALAPYLSDTLESLLVAARKRNEADMARAPDEKPSFAEGDLFSSLFEGPNAAEVVADSARGQARVASVRMTYNGASPAVTWTDRVVLVQQNGRYVIDDIEYGGNWDFATKGTLRSTLVAALANPQ